MWNVIRLLLTCLVCWGLPGQAIAVKDESPRIRVALLQEEDSVEPGRPFWVALQLKIEEGWHVYWKNPGDAGMPLTVEWKLPSGFEAAPLQWPFPEQFNVATMRGFGYSGEVVLLTQITPPLGLASGTTLAMEAEMEWLVCSASNCEPGSTTVFLPLTISSSTPIRKSDQTDVFQRARSLIPQQCIGAVIARQKGCLQLELPAGTVDFDLIRSVEFFPENNDQVDTTADPLITADQNHPHCYLLTLREVAQKRPSATPSLKGVCVLHGQKGGREEVKAFEIDGMMEEQVVNDLVGLLDVDEKPSSSLDGHSPDDWSFEGGLGMALGFAFIGGILLNFMPCVLPVISLKVMSFIRTGAHQSRLISFKHGGMFACGVMVSFWVLAGFMLMLRSYGESVGWGFQLQEPLFVLTLASLLFVFALSLFGLFEWGVSLASWAGQTESDRARLSLGYTGSFLSGVLATAVATPCTGPFLGTTVGFAVTLPLFQSFLIFTSLGFGMCFPYLLLALFPGWLRFLPKPGAWMETFKQFMGFTLLMTVLWLLWVFSAQTNALSLICVLAGFLCFSIGAWVYGKGGGAWMSRRTRLGAYVITMALFLFGVRVMMWPRATWEDNSSQTHIAEQGWEGWERFSPERVAQLRSEGKSILIDFTAKWCLICQANHLVLDGLLDELDRMGVVTMKADWTKNDPMITEALSAFGRNSVPLYVLYGHDQSAPLILPQILTADIVLEHVEKAKQLNRLVDVD